MEKFKRRVLTSALALTLVSDSKAVNLVWDPSPDAGVNKYRLYLHELGTAEPRKFPANTNLYDGVCKRTISDFFLRDNAVYRIWCTALIEPEVITTNGIPESPPSNVIIHVHSALNPGTGYITDENDTTPPYMRITNAPSLSDYIAYSTVTNYIGSEENPIIFNYGVGIEGIVSDNNFIKSFEVSGEGISVNDLNYDINGGKFGISLASNIHGTNRFFVTKEDFVGNRETNGISYINLGNGYDSDGDGLNDLEEKVKHKTNPHERDSDRDGADDNEEILRGYNPLDARDKFKPILTGINPPTLEFYAKEGGYILLGSTNLSEYFNEYLKINLDRWSIITSTNVTSEGRTTFTINQPESDVMFYRVLPQYDFIMWSSQQGNKIREAEWRIRMEEDARRWNQNNP